jgi:hypothetical protein
VPDYLERWKIPTVRKVRENLNERPIFIPVYVHRFSDNNETPKKFSVEKLMNEIYQNKQDLHFLTI